MALADAETRLSWAQLDAQMDRVAARLQAAGRRPRRLDSGRGPQLGRAGRRHSGTLRAGAIAGLITSTATGEQMAAMIVDSGAKHLFLDDKAAETLAGHGYGDVAHIAMMKAGRAKRFWLDGR